MPMIQLIKRDSSIIELEASSIQISVQRNVMVHPIPLLATRAGLDLNQPQVGITIDGVLTDDETSSGGSGAEFSMDLSTSISSSGATSWHSSLEAANWAAVLEELNGVAITFKVKGHIDASLQEATELLLFNGGSPTFAAPTGVFRVICDISGTSNTSTLSTAIMNSLNSGSTIVNGSGGPLSAHITVSQSKGQNALMSAISQTNNTLATPTLDELLTVKNISMGENGNSSVSVRKYQNGSLGNWNKQFFVTNMTNGATPIQMTKGDKLQDLLNSIINPSVGGALISPQVLTGSLIDLPDSIASFDSAQFLNIDSAKAVKKMIVGVRIPYETLLSSTTGNRELRQFLIPAGPGTDHSAESNNQPFDPSETINGKVIRPNPFLQQGVAIPVVVQSFDPGYDAGDSVWTYQISLAPVEQLVGL